MHPALLRLLRLLPRLAARHGVPLSVCGELASQPAMLALLMGLGVREFSMTPTALGTAAARRRVERSRRADARLARQAARTGLLAELEHHVEQALAQSGHAVASRWPNHRRPSVSEIPRVDKPWGYELHWAKTDRYVGKIIHINKGHALSLQYHNKKDETIMLLSGKLLFEIQQDGELVKHEVAPLRALPRHAGHRAPHDGDRGLRRGRSLDAGARRCRAAGRPIRTGEEKK